MATAIVWAGRSKDPSTQVGACYVDENECAKISLDKNDVEYIKYSNLQNDVTGVHLYLEEGKAEDPIKIKRLKYKN